MVTLIPNAVHFHDETVQGEEIREFVGRISTETDEVSIGLLAFPEGWSEPPQRPDFDEYTVVLEGTLYVDTDSVGTIPVKAGQGILTPRGERIQYRTPEPGGAKYLAVCLPAFSPAATRREPLGSELPKTAKPAWNTQSRIVLCRRPTYLQGAGMHSKRIEEYFGLLNSNATALSIARIVSTEGCVDEFHRVNYDKYYIILKGAFHIQWEGTEEIVIAGPNQAVCVPKNSSTRFDTPKPGGAEYLCVCLPARDLDFDCRELLTDIKSLYFSE